MTVGVGLIGCGLIGTKRAAALGPARLVACTDVNPDRAEALARLHHAAVEPDWQALLARNDVDAVIVATTNDALAPITLAAVREGKDVLVEKPAARSPAELRPLLDAVASSRSLVRVGFNHRYHPAFRQLRIWLDEGALGPLMFLRARYGHGGRLGYEREWRADPLLAGGGELIDQGVHLIDLSRWILGDFQVVDGFAHTYFWDMPVDDNAFLMLRNAAQQMAWLHVSCTEWKNLFSFELYGRDAKVSVEGLGGSYGVERLTLYRMLPEMGPPDTTCWEFPRGDDSWEWEFREFLEDITLRREPAASLEDALAALEIVETIYSRSQRDHLP